MVEEYRYPVARRSWSFPQGGFPHGETGTPEELARMELVQETGLRAARFTHLGTLTAAHGMTSQYCDYFLATELTPGPPDREPEEMGMRADWFSRDQFEQMTREGLITDDSTVAAYALLLLRERGQGWGLGVYYVPGHPSAGWAIGRVTRHSCLTGPWRGRKGAVAWVWL